VGGGHHQQRYAKMKEHLQMRLKEKQVEQVVDAAALPTLTTPSSAASAALLLRGSVSSRASSPSASSSPAERRRIDDLVDYINGDVKQPLPDPKKAAKKARQKQVRFNALYNELILNSYSIYINPVNIYDSTTTIYLVHYFNTTITRFEYSIMDLN